MAFENVLISRGIFPDMDKGGTDMTALLWLLFTLSISGSVLALLVLCLSPLLRRWPTLRYYLWLPVVVRLLLPFAPGESLISRIAVYLDTPGQLTPLRAEDVPATPQVQASTPAIVYVPSDGNRRWRGIHRRPFKALIQSLLWILKFRRGLRKQAADLPRLALQGCLRFCGCSGWGLCCCRMSGGFTSCTTRCG